MYKVNTVKETRPLINYQEVGKNAAGYDVIFVIADNCNIELNGHSEYNGNWEFYFSDEDKSEVVKFTSSYSGFMPLIHKEDNQFSIVLVPWDFIVGS